MSTQAFATETARWAAVRRRNADADGHFLYSVKTTGVYCRPSCAARPARRENVAFHITREAAERAGFRPCKRCRPDLPPKAEREAALIAASCRSIETAEEVPSLAALAAEAGVSVFHFHRLFKRIAGVTPKAYAAAQRQQRVQKNLSNGSGVTEAIYDAGFNSSGRFYESAGKMLGMKPSTYRKGGQGEAVWHAVGRCSLGRVLVAATARGVCAIFLGDDDKLLAKELARRFPKAELCAPKPEFSDWVAKAVRYVDDPTRSGGLGLPLDIQGTAFQCRVWEALREIPAGETTTYGALAKSIGKPRAVRAVGAACGANPIAVAIPCHRALAADGALTGYRWGIARKKSLLAREQG
jgi:AraC family transcriptional regulator, regulatory protein of adaptative response / methylated-DNA-[protein]-cysteine methyltransferase